MAADASAQITELKADDHACLTFGEAEELFDLTAAYVRDGAARAAAATRTVTLGCPPEIAAGFARLGLAGVPGIRLVTADG